MAEIDKGLPNTRTKLDIPSQEEIEEVSVQEPIDNKGSVLFSYLNPNKSKP